MNCKLERLNRKKKKRDQISLRNLHSWWFGSGLLETRMIIPSNGTWQNTCLYKACAYCSVVSRAYFSLAKQFPIAVSRCPIRRYINNHHYNLKQVVEKKRLPPESIWTNICIKRTLCQAINTLNEIHYWTNSKKEPRIMFLSLIYPVFEHMWDFNSTCHCPWAALKINPFFSRGEPHKGYSWSHGRIWNTDLYQFCEAQDRTWLPQH